MLKLDELKRWQRTQRQYFSVTHPVTCDCPHIHSTLHTIRRGKVMASHMHSSFPSTRLEWASEVEWSHGDRVLSLLRAKHIDVCVLPPPNNKKQSNILIFTAQNITSPLSPLLPFECFKHISRVFHLPHACSDLAWIHHCPTLRALISAGVSVEERSVNEYG